MTPRDFDPGVVQAKLRFLDELLRDLADLGDISVERLNDDRIVRHALERILTQMVESAVAINSHVASSLVGRSPADYRGSFDLAAEAGAISRDLTAKLAPWAGIRNLLVHEDLSLPASTSKRRSAPHQPAQRRQVARSAGGE